MYVVLSLVAIPALALTKVEKIRNPKVLVTEVTLASGESQANPDKPSMVVYMNSGLAEVDLTGGQPQKNSVEEGGVIYEAASSGTLKNIGSAPLHFARIEFLTDGSTEAWGMSGLAPNYRMLLENRYARAYEIRIAPHTVEPQHTHHDRVVVTLSGAQLVHILPDGTRQPSTLTTGEIVWRLGATHVGHNLGDTELWVVAVEPK
jgi:quercetin dioxygenase-like cupin family protein